MSRKTRRFFGILLICTAALGVLFSLAGLVLVWSTGSRMRAQVIRAVDLASRAVVTSDQGITVLTESLANTYDSILFMRGTASDIATSLNQTVPMVDATGTLVGVNMANLIRDMQSSLASAQTSAQLVDDTLRIITALPLIGQRYAPSQSLAVSIAQISSSLDGLPEQLGMLKDNLDISAENIVEVQVKMAQFSSNLGRVAQNIQGAQDVVRQYQAQIGELKGNLQELARSIPTWFIIIQAGLTIFFAWLAFSQIGLALQGWGLYQSAAMNGLAV